MHITHFTKEMGSLYKLLPDVLFYISVWKSWKYSWRSKTRNFCNKNLLLQFYVLKMLFSSYSVHINNTSKTIRQSIFCFAKKSSICFSKNIINKCLVQNSFFFIIHDFITYSILVSFVSEEEVIFLSLEVVVIKLCSIIFSN